MRLLEIDRRIRISHRFVGRYRVTISRLFRLAGRKMPVGQKALLVSLVAGRPFVVQEKTDQNGCYCLAL
jgi:hypothetical protein